MAGIVLDQRQFSKLLKNNGYRFDRQTGGHYIWTKAGHNPISFNGKLNPIIAQRLIKENKLVL